MLRKIVLVPFSILHQFFPVRQLGAAYYLCLVSLFASSVLDFRLQISGKYNLRLLEHLHVVWLSF